MQTPKIVGFISKLTIIREKKYNVSNAFFPLNK